MNITSINNNRQVSFKGAYDIEVPKIPPFTLYEYHLNDYFNGILKEQIAIKPQKLLRRLAFRLGINPEAVGIAQYPGYKYLQRDIRQKGPSRVESNVYCRFGVDLSLPREANRYHFHVLTGQEKDSFLQSQRSSSKLANAFASINYVELLEKVKTFDDEDMQYLKKLGLYMEELRSFQSAIAQNGQEKVTVRDLSELREAITRILNQLI